MEKADLLLTDDCTGNLAGLSNPRPHAQRGVWGRSFVYIHIYTPAPYPNPKSVSRKGHFYTSSAFSRSRLAILIRSPPIRLGLLFPASTFIPLLTDFRRWRIPPFSFSAGMGGGPTDQSRRSFSVPVPAERGSVTSADDVARVMYCQIWEIRRVQRIRLTFMSASPMTESRPNEWCSSQSA
jgi:hypothetical protein